MPFFPIAAAVDFFATPWGGPPSISGHNNYFLWGPRGHDGSVIIRLDDRREDLLKFYASAEAVGITSNPPALPQETGRTVWICRGRYRRLDTDWPTVRHYD